MSLPFPAIALDFSGDALRLAHVIHRRGRAEIATLFSTPLPEHAVEAGAIAQPQEVAGVITEVFKKHRYAKLPRHALCILPDAHCFVFTVEVRPDEENAAEAIRWEAARQVPFDIQNMILDWEVLDVGEHTALYQVAAAPKEVVSAYLEVLDTAHLTPVGIAPASLAAAQALTLSPEQQPAIILLLDATSSTLMLTGKQGVLLTMQSNVFAERQLLTLLQEKLRLSPKEALRALELYGVEQPLTKNVVAQTLNTHLKELVKRIEELSTFSEGKGSPVRTIALTGGGSMLKGLDEQLHRRLRIATVTHPFDPLLVYAQRDKGTPAEEEAPSFAAVLGLGLSTL